MTPKKTNKKEVSKNKKSSQIRKSNPKKSTPNEKVPVGSKNNQKKSPVEKEVESPDISQLALEKRKNNEKNMKWLKIESAVSVVVCLILLFLAIGVVTSKTREVFIAADQQGRYKTLTPLYQPKHSNAFVGDWLNKCLVKTFDFSYANYERKLAESVDECFSDEGSVSLKNALVNSGNLEAIKSKRLYSTLSLDYTPMVVREMKPNSASQPYRWALQSRGVITLSSQTSNDPNKVSVTAVVSRASFEDTNEGLVIDRIIIN